MVCERLRVLLGAELLQEPGRALDVGEQEGDGAGRHLRGRRPGSGGQRFVLGEDGPLEAAQLLARLQPELLVEKAAAGLVDGQRVGLPAGAVEGEHELATEPLAQRVLLDELLELGHELRVASELEVGVDPLLEGCQALLLEAGARGPRERSVELRERELRARERAPR